jgi:hypothetical protein
MSATTNVLLPSEVVQQELRRRKLLALLDREQPAWNPKDHPELQRGAATWVSRIRKSEQKFRPNC